MTLTPGTRLGPYEIVSLLGKGGMGEVYRSRDTRLDRDVAVKVHPTELSEDATYRRRLEREAKTISQLQHSNVCMLLDIGSRSAIDPSLEGLALEILHDQVLSRALGPDVVQRADVRVLKLGDDLRLPL